MPTLKPIKVTLRRKPEGGIKWPDWNSLAPSTFNNKKPSVFIDQEGMGWHYNKIANLGTGADFGEAVTAVPAAAAGAMATLPDCELVSDEATFEDFYDTKAHAHEPATLEDTDVLQAIAAKRQIGFKETASDRAALDPDNPRSGVRRNQTKTWQRFKTQRNITLTFA